MSVVCGRKRYTRDEVLACKELANLIVLPFLSLPTTFPRGNRKKSQSNDIEECLPSGGSQEVLAAVEAEQPPHWHRSNRQQQWHASEHQQSGNYPHPRQRYPSGPHGDIKQADSNTTLRPNPMESRRGVHGDWSKGCAGWRQRSYSGSDRSNVVSGHNQGVPSISRGRGGGSSGITYSEADDSVFRGSGRGRYGRNNFPHRGFTPRFHHSSSGVYRPSLFVGVSNPLNESEDFWQDDDWFSSEVDRDAQAANSYSEPCSVGPPPGFDLPPKQLMSIADGERPVNVFSSTSTHDDTGHLHSSVSTIDVSNSAWYYIDSTGQTQGPFGNQQMSTWLASGYLPLCIEIRRECDECFLTLVDHMSLAGRVPFWGGYNQPPITRSNLPSILMSASRRIPVPQRLSHTPPPPPTSVVAQQIPHIQPPALLHNPPSNTDVAPAAALLSAAAELASGVHAGVDASPIVSSTVTEPVSQPPSLSPASGFGAVDFSNTGPTDASAFLSGGNSELEHLYSEAQVLASHVAKVDAERKELAAKLAAISLTAVKLLTGQSPPISGDAKVRGDADTDSLNAVAPSSSADPALQSTNQKVVAQEMNPVSALFDSETRKECLNGFASQYPQECPQKPTVSEKIFENTSEHPHAEDSLDTCVKQPADSTAFTTKKNKKPKKTKKKLTSEQERQLAWDTEFARRKASALAKKLSEESEAARMAEEEAASLAEQQAALEREQKRILLEHRKREAQRAKEEDQLGQLRLPQSARWGISAADTASSAPKCASLLSTQTAQAREGTVGQLQEVAMTKQTTNQAPELFNSPIAAHPQTQVATANSDKRAIPNQSAAGKNSAVKLNTPSKLEPSNTRKVLDQADRSKPPAASSHVSAIGDSRRVLVPISPPDVPRSTAASSSSLSVAHPITAGSIWDLPNDGKTVTATSSAKSSKKNKKKSATAPQSTSEGVSFAAKEQLAHWCESQLSFMPLSGVDLPTLVDLLCELEGTDQIVEFIEASLGRSKRTLKFSKAFLEKRACIRDTVR